MQYCSLFFWAPKSLQMVITVMKLKDAYSLEGKVQCYKEQYCIGTWNVRSTNQGKLEVVKQEMATANNNIFRISELKWTEMGEFNSDDHYIYYCG